MDPYIPCIQEAVEFGDLYAIPEAVVNNWYEFCELNNWEQNGTPIRNWKGALISYNGRRIHTINAQATINRRNHNG